MQNNAVSTTINSTKLLKLYSRFIKVKLSLCLNTSPCKCVKLRAFLSSARDENEWLFMHRPLYSQGDGGWVSPRVGPDVVKRKITAFAENLTSLLQFTGSNFTGSTIPAYKAPVCEFCLQNVLGILQRTTFFSSKTILGGVPIQLGHFLEVLFNIMLQSTPCHSK